MSGKKWDLWGDCEALNATGKHQYKRFHVNGHYEYRCRRCDKLEDEPIRYATAKAALEGWLNKNLDEKYTISPFDGMWDPTFDVIAETATDLREVYGIPLTSESEAPTAPPPDAEERLKRRWRKRHKEAEIRRNIQSRTDEIISKLKEMLEEKKLTIDERSAQNCLRTFMFVTEDHGRPLTGNQLENLTAAVVYVYHCVPNMLCCPQNTPAETCVQTLSQDNVVGYPGSLFPKLSRRTLNEWVKLVKKFEAVSSSSSIVNLSLF